MIQEQVNLTNECLPSNIIAEQKVLGAIIVNQQVAERVIEFLKVEHFFIELHQEIYSALLKLIDADMQISFTTIQNLLENNKDFVEVGGHKYLAKLLTLSLMVVDIRDYGRMIFNDAVKRKLIEISEEAIVSAKNISLVDDYKQPIETLENKIYKLVNDDTKNEGFIASSYLVEGALDNINKVMKGDDKIIGVSSGLIDIDKKLGGFRDTDLIIIAGRPSMGKTAFALNLAVNACLYYQSNNKEQKSVGFFSLEMSASDLITRIISMRSLVDSTRFIDGKINEENYNKIRTVSNEINKLPLFIDDSAALTISAIRLRAKKLKRQHNLGILFIDYLQLIRCTEKMDNRTLEVSEITRSLKALAKELNIPIVALSQLSRAVEQRNDKRPMLSDLRDSGSIEQDADIVMFIYRDEYYLKGKEPPMNTQAHTEWLTQLQQSHNIAEITISKHRKGPTGNVKLHYEDKCSKFANLML